MKSNDHPLELISAFLDGEIDSDDRALVEAHLVACEACRTLAGDLRALDAAIAAEGVPPVPSALSARISWGLRGTTAAARRPPRRSALGRVLAVGGAVAAALILGFVVVKEGRPPAILEQPSYDAKDLASSPSASARESAPQKKEDRLEALSGEANRQAPAAAAAPESPPSESGSGGRRDQGGASSGFAPSPGTSLDGKRARTALTKTGRERDQTMDRRARADEAQALQGGPEKGTVTPKDLEQENKEHLRSLGYVGGAPPPAAPPPVPRSRVQPEEKSKSKDEAGVAEGFALSPPAAPGDTRDSDSTRRSNFPAKRSTAGPLAGGASAPPPPTIPNAVEKAVALDDRMSAQSPDTGPAFVVRSYVFEVMGRDARMTPLVLHSTNLATIRREIASHAGVEPTAVLLRHASLAFGEKTAISGSLVPPGLSAVAESVLQPVSSFRAGPQSLTLWVGPAESETTVPPKGDSALPAATPKDAEIRRIRARLCSSSSSDQPHLLAEDRLTPGSVLLVPARFENRTAILAFEIDLLAADDRASDLTRRFDADTSKLVTTPGFHFDDSTPVPCE